MHRSVKRAYASAHGETPPDRRKRKRLKQILQFICQNNLQQLQVLALDSRRSAHRYSENVAGTYVRKCRQRYETMKRLQRLREQLRRGTSSGALLTAGINPP